MDLLRVIACVGVVSVHMKQAYAVKDSSSLLNIIYKFCDAGANGVALLFVLSGYFAWQTTESGTFNNVHYLKHRFLRISPAYFIVVIIYIIFGMLPLDKGVLRYFTYTQGWIPSQNFAIYNNIGALWTMSCFVCFYTMVPILKKYVKNLTKAVAAVVGMFCFGKFAGMVFQYFLIKIGSDAPDLMENIFPLCNIYFFMMGVLVYYVIQEEKQYVFFLISIIIINILIIIGKMDYFMYTVLGMMVIILSDKIEISMKQNSMIRRTVCLLSMISYEVYLTHPLFIEISKLFTIPGEVILIPIITMLFSYVLHSILDRLLNVRENK